MELNREQIIKALECCIANDWNSTKCNECPIYNGGGGCIDKLKEITIALISSQEQTIFDLENRLKECENGYEETLYLERCKLHDAEQKNKELIEENERLQKALNTDISIVRVSRGSGKTAHLREVGRIKADAIRADTVRKMQERLTKEFDRMHKNNFMTVEVRQWIIDQIAKEMLEGADG